jgi:hypothetical protein
MIHPVFAYNKSNINKSEIKLKGYQKQGVLGLGKYVNMYRKCYKYFFNTFIIEENSEEKLVDNYFILLNKILLKTFQYRNNLFSIRFITYGDIPRQFNKYDDERFINEVSGNDKYLGILERNINPLIHNKDYGNKVYYYVYNHRNTI